MNIDKFKKWLQQRGCEILPNTNEYEKLRFKGDSVGVIYKSGKFSGPYVTDSVLCFKKNKHWSGGAIKTGRKANYKKEKRAIIKRDGQACFCCGDLLGDDITLEHLIPLNQGGQNNLYNMVLMHEECNNKMSHLPIYKKVNLILKTRTEKIISHD